MPGCMLRLSGRYLELSRAVAHASISFTESRGSARRRERGGATEADEADEVTFYCTVSEADGDCVPQQIRDAKRFLSDHADALRALRSTPGVARATLDFGWTIPRDAAGQWNWFPVSLLSRCTSLRIGITVSVYLSEDRET